MPADCSTGARHEGGVTLHQASVRNVRTCCPDVKGAVQVDSLCKNESTDAGHRDGGARSRVWTEGAPSFGLNIVTTWMGMMSMPEAKSFDIAKLEVWDAYKRVALKLIVAQLELTRSVLTNSIEI